MVETVDTAEVVSKAEAVDTAEAADMAGAVDTVEVVDMAGVVDTVEVAGTVVQVGKEADRIRNLCQARNACPAGNQVRTHTRCQGSGTCREGRS